MPLSLTQTTAPSVEPISTDEAKTHLRVDVADEDTYIDTLIVAARGYAEEYTHRQLCLATWTWKLDRFPQVFRPPRPPLSSVTSIAYIDTAGDAQTLSSSIYDTDTYSEPGRITEAYGEVWPSTRSDANAVTVVYPAGYGGAADVPLPIVQAIKLLVGQWFAQREPIVVGVSVGKVPDTVDALLAPYRVMEFG